jgi:hypothetical protein
VEIRLTRTETHKFYEVTDAPVMLDASRRQFLPEEVHVIHRGVPWWVGVKGWSVKGRRFIQAGYGIQPDGTVEPHYRNGPAPQWLVELVTQTDPTRPAPAPTPS